MKFAKSRPAEAACRSILADARTLVERTRFVPPPVAEPEATTADGAEATTADEAETTADDRTGAAVP